MSQIVDRIRYSKFGRKYLSEGPMYEFLRRGKHLASKIKQRIKAKLPGSRHYRNILTVFEEYLTNSDIEQAPSDCQVDVIVPIYNGYEYLVRLFEDLPKTDMSCRFILVDDKSTDERVLQIEKEFIKQHENAVLLQNEQNCGFVMSVNRGIESSKNHVALVNTDTELPQGWLERLMYPILHLDKIASSTPYANSGTIFSFPDFCYNNLIYRGKSVDVLDSYFRRLKPKYAVAPTGVGFCMGMNREAIREIGALDAETFGKGFGEENDWCQRAIKKGYLNVQVENLFVYHKHGGSFLSEEKERLLEKNMEALRKRYPRYDFQVATFIQKDPNKKLRRFVQMLIDTHECRSILYFDHGLGGGATGYLNIQKERFWGQGACVSVIRYQIGTNNYHFEFDNGDIQLKYEFQSLEDVWKIGKQLHFDEIYVNELVTYPRLWQAQKIIADLKVQQGSRLVMLFHDYFALCPTINLMDEKQCYCGIPQEEQCEECYAKRGYSREYECESRREWVQRWKSFLTECTEVRTFSEDTRRRVEDAFGSDLALTMVPHQADYMFPIQKDCKTTDSLNIGLLGVLAAHKGSGFVRELLEEIKRKNLNIRIKLIGETEGIDLSHYDAFSQTGPYSVGQLPRLTYENDIDIFLIASVWPETFSYTAEEIMKMGMPVAAFDLGAPANRIRGYAKGLILEKRDAGAVLRQLIDFAEQTCKIKDMKRTTSQKVVFISEYVSFSSRYRMDHLREELLYQGVAGEIWSLKKIPSAIAWDQIAALVIYRCRYTEPLKSLLEQAKTYQVRIIYDVDDYIFDFEKIRNLAFMKEPEYRKFDVYCDEIAACMQMSDGIIVSTNHLRKAVEEVFSEKPVYINRNMASAEMLILSTIAQRRKKVDSNRIVLGYFSGSHTHNRDFEIISDLLAEFLEKHENVYFKIVGCLELPKHFKKFQNRIIEIGFLDWRELPAEIASVDINLMPLERTFFHECKSENKWMEAALVKVPTIGSYMDEIAAVTQPDVNIILCKTDEEWLTGLERLVIDKTYRIKMGENAHAFALKHRITLRKDRELLHFVLGDKI